MGDAYGWGVNMDVCDIDGMQWRSIWVVHMSEMYGWNERYLCERAMYG